MIRITNSPVTYTGAGFAPAAGSEGRDRTMAYSILKAHNTAPGQIGRASCRERVYVSV